jgi:hypothetical protein
LNITRIPLRFTRPSWDDIQHYQKILVAIKETIRLMRQIDELVPKWTIE